MTTPFDGQCSMTTDSLWTTVQEMVAKENQYKTKPELYVTGVPNRDGEADPGDCDRDELVDLSCREQMSEWCLQIIDHCKFSHETVEIAMNLLDRALSRGDEFSRSLLSDRSAYQLACMTALYTTIKVHEHKAISPETMAGLSHGAYTAKQIEEMEIRLLGAVRWLVHPPTTTAFAYELIELLASYHRQLGPPCVEACEDLSGMKDALLELCTMQTSLAIVDYGTFGGIHPSAIAVAALRNALGSLGVDEYQDRSDSILMKVLVSDPSIIPDFSRYTTSVQRLLLEAVIRKEGSESVEDQPTEDAGDEMEYEVEGECSKAVSSSTGSECSTLHSIISINNVKDCIEVSMGDSGIDNASPTCVKSHPPQDRSMSRLGSRQPVALMA